MPAPARLIKDIPGAQLREWNKLLPIKMQWTIRLNTRRERVFIMFTLAIVLTSLL
jgi:hypothetical protein